MESTVWNIRRAGSTVSKFDVASVMYWVYICIGGIGIVDNLSIVIVMAFSKLLRKIHNVNHLILNQSLLDLFLAVSLVIQNYTEELDASSPEAMERSCNKIWRATLLIWTPSYTSTYNLVLLTLERYLAIVHPFFHKTHVTLKKVRFMAIFVWVGFASLMTAYYFTGYRIEYRAKHGNVQGACKAALLQGYTNAGKITIIFFSMFFTFWLPVLFMIFAYACMMLSLKNRPFKTKAKANIFKICLIISTVFIVCWSPITSLIAFHFGVIKSGGVNVLWYNIAMLAAMCNCCLNPIIYSLQYEKFQEAAKEVFRQFFCLKMKPKQQGHIERCVNENVKDGRKPEKVFDISGNIEQTVM